MIDYKKTKYKRTRVDQKNPVVKYTSATIASVTEIDVYEVEIKSGENHIDAIQRAGANMQDKELIEDMKSMEERLASANYSSIELMKMIKEEVGTGLNEDEIFQMRYNESMTNETLLEGEIILLNFDKGRQSSAFVVFGFENDNVLLIEKDIAMAFVGSTFDEVADVLKYIEGKVPKVVAKKGTRELKVTMQIHILPRKNISDDDVIGHLTAQATRDIKDVINDLDSKDQIIINKNDFPYKTTKLGDYKWKNKYKKGDILIRQPKEKGNVGDAVVLILDTSDVGDYKFITNIEISCGVLPYLLDEYPLFYISPSHINGLTSIAALHIYDRYNSIHEKTIVSEGYKKVGTISDADMVRCQNAIANYQEALRLGNINPFDFEGNLKFFHDFNSKQQKDIIDNSDVTRKDIDEIDKKLKYCSHCN